MASVSRDANGTKRVLFTDPDGKRRSVRLGAVPVKLADAFRLRVEALNVARITETAWDGDLSVWVRNLPDVMHRRLARVGLVEPRANAEAPTLAALIDQYEQTATVKPSTVAARRQATKSLLEYFGGDTLLNAMTPADADRWRRTLTDEGLAKATIAKRVHVARALFRKAVRWSMLPSNPFADLRAGPQSNPDRLCYVPHETIRAVLTACPDDQWRAIVALVRYAGLRCPSELLLLRWGDVNWERGRLNVRSPKTAGHEGHAVRVVPIAPELRPMLLTLFDEAEPGTEWVVPRPRDPGVNLRTTFAKIIARAGVKPWPRAFHNMRASCATDWCERFPAHVVAGWLGHSPLIAARHYLQTRDAHFELATGGAKSGAVEAQKAAQQQAAPNRIGSQESPEVPVKAGVMRDRARPCETLQNEGMGDTGLEPVTSCMSSTRSSQLS